MSSRERTMIGVAAAVGLFFAIKWVIVEQFLNPINTREDRLAALDSEYDNKELELLKQVKAERELAQWKKASLPDRSGTADQTVVYREYLTGIMKNAGIKEPKIDVMQLNPKKQYSTLPVNVSMNATAEQIGKLLFAFENTPLLHFIKMIDIKPVVKDGNITHLDVRLNIEVLAFRDADDIKKLETGKAPANKRLSDYAYFADKNVFQPTSIESISRQAPVVAPAEDHRAKTRFTAAVTSASSGQLECWFKNDQANKTSFVAIGGKLDIPGMSAIVRSFDSDQNLVLLEVAGKVGSVRLGETLSNWKEVPRSPAVLTKSG